MLPLIRFRSPHPSQFYVLIPFTIISPAHTIVSISFTIISPPHTIHSLPVNFDLDLGYYMFLGSFCFSCHYVCLISSVLDECFAVDFGVEI